MTQVNEFAINLPMTSVGGLGADMAMTATPSVDITPMMQLPPDVDPHQFDHISVYMDSAQVTNYDPRSPIVQIDMVLSVSISDPAGTGCSNTYKMVKRVAMDKCKLACDAENLTPVTVVEDEEDPAEVKKIMEAFYHAQRAREIAGLVESAGKLTAKVKFSYDDESAAQKAKGTNARASAEMDLKNVRDKAHARHVFDVKHSHKYQNVKITRVTMKEGV